MPDSSSSVSFRPGTTRVTTSTQYPSSLARAIPISREKTTRVISRSVLPG